MISTDSLLQVAIEKTDDGPITRIVTSPHGQAEARFALSLNRNEVGAIWQGLTDDTEATASEFDRIQAQARTVGEKLFSALFAEPLGALLHDSMTTAYQQRGLLHLRLSLPEDPALLTLPWEFLFDPQRQLFLSLAEHTPLMRYIHRRHQIRPLNVARPLRVLVVVADAGGSVRIDSNREWLKLIDTLDYLGMDGRLVIERLERPTLFELQRRLRRQPYHVLHVIGHAFYDEAAQDGRLAIEDEVGHGRQLSGEHLGQILRDHYSTRLVILQSTGNVLDPRNPLGLVAHSLVPRGIPAAIVLPYRLPDKLMLAFLHDLYTAVADCQPIDVAMVKARSALAREFPNHFWGMPWIVARTVDGYIFDDGSRPKPAQPAPGRREPSLLERVLRSNLTGEP